MKFVPIVQWIEHRPPKPEIEVRILVGTQESNTRLSVSPTPITSCNGKAGAGPLFRVWSGFYKYTPRSILFFSCGGFLASSHAGHLQLLRTNMSTPASEASFKKPIVF